MNISTTELDDMSGIPGYYEKSGFHYIERDSPPEMINIYSNDSIKIFKENLNQILSKSDENWRWEDCGNFPDPNPSSILPDGGVGYQAFGKRKSKRSRKKYKSKPKSKSKRSRKKYKIKFKSKSS